MTQKIYALDMPPKCTEYVTKTCLLPTEAILCWKLSRNVSR